MISLEGTLMGKFCLYMQFLLIVYFDQDDYTPNNTLFYIVYRLNPQKYGGHKSRRITQPSSQRKMAISILIQLIYHDMQHSW